MKKKTFKMMAILLTGLFLVSPVWAACQGNVITGKDGHKYCQSTRVMNWWSGFAWCEAQGRKLISLKHCNGINGTITGNSQCPNFVGAGIAHAMTSSVPNSTYYYYINASSLSVATNTRSSASYSPICE